MRQGLRALAAGALGLAVSVIAACGSNSGLLSSSDASNLSTQIEQVYADVSKDNCSAVPDDLGTLEQDFNDLPSSLNSTLRANLQQGVDKVKTLALEKCPSATVATTTATTTTTTTTAKTQTTPTQTTTTSTTPTQTTTTPSTTTATPPSNTGTTSTGPASGGTGFGSQGGSGGGGGNGDGNGNGEHGG
jgi:hypothetical protein